MKYGVVFYKDTDNIGDDIQSYAAMRFLPRTDYLIDREHLSDFVCSEPVAVILNGWFLHHKYNWPPASCIWPLCVSMHFSKNDYMGIGYGFLCGVGNDYLKAYEPIGCRDKSTLDIMCQRGIEAYLSGCMTLTLQSRQRKQTTEKYICLVDVSKQIYEKACEQTDGTDSKIRCMSHRVEYKQQSDNWEMRMNRVEELLDIYQNASCVVTKRLHCALPCLALGTPVLLILDKESDDVARYSHFTELLYTCSTNEYLNQETDFQITDPPVNQTRYVKEKNRLIETICQFIDQTANGTPPEAFWMWNQKDQRTIDRWRMRMMADAAEFAAKQVDELLRQKGGMEIHQFEEIRQLSERYENNTQTWKDYVVMLKKEEQRLNDVIATKEKEEQRLNGVIGAKEKEEQRLNGVIRVKEKEEQRLNGLLEVKEKEEARLNGMMECKEKEEDRLNEIIKEKEEVNKRLESKLQKKEEELRKIHDFIEDKEQTSIIWLIFFSKTYQQAPGTRRLKLLKESFGRNIHKVILFKKRKDNKK